MYRHLAYLTAFCGLSLLAFSCGSDPAEAEAAAATEDDGINITFQNDEGEEQSINIDLNEKDLQELQNGLSEAFEQIADNTDENGEKIEVMNFRTLKSLLPESLLGLDRTRHQGEKSGAMGFTVSQAEAKYEEDDRYLEIKIIDAAQMGVAKIGMLAWAGVEVDREGDFGYERTTTIDGHKAFEKWDANTEKGELTLLYNDRYIVTLNGRNLDDDALRKVLRRLDLDELE